MLAKIFSSTLTIKSISTKIIENIINGTRNSNKCIENDSKSINNVDNYHEQLNIMDNNAKNYKNKYFIHTKKHTIHNNLLNNTNLITNIKYYSTNNKNETKQTPTQNSSNRYGPNYYHNHYRNKKYNNPRKYHYHEQNTNTTTQQQQIKINKQIQATLQKYNNNSYIMHPNGYGYYDWHDDACYKKCIEQYYFLDDLVTGFRILKKKKMDKVIDKYQEHHLNFMMYVYMLFPAFEEEIVQQFWDTFVQLQEKQDFYLKQPFYAKLAKSMCYEGASSKPSSKSQKIKQYLRRRIYHPYNLQSLQKIYENVSQNCYEHMTDLLQLFNIFKQMSYKIIEQKKYKIQGKQLKLIISIYQKIILMDAKLKNQTFFSTLPQIYRQSQQTFLNMLQILPEIFSFNFVLFIHDSQILGLNKKISQCQKFVHQNSENKGRNVHVLLRRYSQHLVLVNKIDVINFNNLLETI